MIVLSHYFLIAGILLPFELVSDIFLVYHHYKMKEELSNLKVENEKYKNQLL